MVSVWSNRKQIPTAVAGKPRRTSYIFGKSFSVSFLVLNGGQYLQRKDKKFRNSVNFAGLVPENTNNRCGEMTSR